MKRHCEGKNGILMEIWCVIWLLLVLGIGIHSQLDGISVPSVIAAAVCLAFAATAAVIMFRNRVFTWGDFEDDGVSAINLFRRSFMLRYDQCSTIGIGYYRKGLPGSFNNYFGSNVYYIFFSAAGFDERYRGYLNKWRPGKAGFMVRFDQELYDYLLTKVPAQRVNALKWDYQELIVNRRTL